MISDAKSAKLAYTLSFYVSLANMCNICEDSTGRFPDENYAREAWPWATWIWLFKLDCLQMLTAHTPAISCHVYAGSTSNLQQKAVETESYFGCVDSCRFDPDFLAIGHAVVFHWPVEIESWWFPDVGCKWAPDPNIQHLGPRLCWLSWFMKGFDLLWIVLMFSFWSFENLLCCLFILYFLYQSTPYCTRQWWHHELCSGFHWFRSAKG